MCGWVQCPGFVCITQRYAPLPLQPWGWEMPLLRDREAGGCGWLVGGFLRWSSPQWRILSLRPRLEWEGVHMLAERFPFAAGLSLLPCKRSDCFLQKSCFCRKACHPQGFSFLLFLFFTAFAFLHPPPTKCISFSLTQVVSHDTIETLAGKIFWRFPAQPPAWSRTVAHMRSGQQWLC